MMVMEVEFDLNPTDLYNHICNYDWESALHCVEADPIEAKIWVVKREAGDSAHGEIAWRFLPLHSACARQPSLPIISSLIDAYPEGAAARDDNGMYPLHYACANQASPEVIRLLLSIFSEANFARIKTTGSLPIHLAAKWGVSTTNVLDILLDSSISLACAKDFQERSPLEVALQAAHYKDKKEVIHKLKDAAEAANADDVTSSTITSTAWSIQNGTKPSMKGFKSSNTRGDAETIVEKDPISNSTNKSIIRMRAEIIALRAQIQFIRAETDEQVAHEWKEVMKVISELTILDECRSTVEKVNQINSYARSLDNNREVPDDDADSLETEEKMKLKEIKKENESLKSEYDRVKKVYDEYKTKLKTMHNAISELSKHTRKLITEQNDACERLSVMESNTQIVSAYRQTRLQRLLREEKAYYSEVTDVNNEVKSDQRCEFTEALVLKEMDMISEFDAILQNMNNYKEVVD